MTDRPSTLGLMIRPAARIIRELPPSSWLSDDGCCGCDPHRASGLRLRSVLCAQGTPEASTDRLHTCQPSSLNHGCIPCRGFLPSGPTCGPLLSCGVRLGVESTDEKKAVSETPVEEPRLLGGATPFGVGISLTTLDSHRLPHLAVITVPPHFNECQHPSKKIWMLLDVNVAEALLPQPLAGNSKSSGKEKPQRS